MTEVEELASLIIREWHDSFSDNGQVWSDSKTLLERAKAEASEETFKQALALAYSAWPTR